MRGFVCFFNLNNKQTWIEKNNRTKTCCFPLIQKQVFYPRLREFIPNQFNHLIQPEINLLSEN